MDDHVAIKSKSNGVVIEYPGFIMRVMDKDLFPLLSLLTQLQADKTLTDVRAGGWTGSWLKQAMGIHLYQHNDPNNAVLLPARTIDAVYAQLLDREVDAYLTEFAD